MSFIAEKGDNPSVYQLFGPLLRGALRGEITVLILLAYLAFSAVSHPLHCLRFIAVRVIPRVDWLAQVDPWRLCRLNPYLGELLAV